MKRIALVMVMLVTAFSASFAQTVKKNDSAPAPGTAAPAAGAALSTKIAVPLGAIRLENDSTNLIFYTVIALKSADMNQLLAQPKAILERLKDKATVLSYLPARTVMPALAVSESEQLLLGFSLENGASAWRVWYLRIPAKGTRPVPPVFMVSLARGLSDAAGSPLVLSTADYQLPILPIRVDGRFVDWLKYDDLMYWSDRNPPSTVIRQEGSAAAVISLATSQYWAKGGTDLEHFRMIRSKSELLVMISSRSLMSKGLSYVLRLYEPLPTAGNAAAASSQPRNKFVLEIPIDAPTGPALVWEDGKADPKVAGDFASADYYLEARFRLSDLPAGLATMATKDWQIEVSAIFSQPGQSEEFNYGRFPSTAIVKVD